MFSAVCLIVYVTIEYVSQIGKCNYHFKRCTSQHGVDYLKAACIEKGWETATLTVFGHLL